MYRKKGLVKMQGEKVTLQNIKGIGDKISEKILNSVGGEENLQKIVENVDVEKIANIDGISQRKAIEIMNQLLNNPTYEFIKSDRAMEIYEDIINKILAYSNTSYSKNRKTNQFCDGCKKTGFTASNNQVKRINEKLKGS